MKPAFLILFVFTLASCGTFQHSVKNNSDDAYFYRRNLPKTELTPTVDVNKIVEEHPSQVDPSRPEILRNEAPSDVNPNAEKYYPEYKSNLDKQTPKTDEKVEQKPQSYYDDKDYNRDLRRLNKWNRRNNFNSYNDYRWRNRYFYQPHYDPFYDPFYDSFYDYGWYDSYSYYPRNNWSFGWNRYGGFYGAYNWTMGYNPYYPGCGMMNPWNSFCGNNYYSPYFYSPYSYGSYGYGYNNYWHNPGYYYNDHKSSKNKSISKPRESMGTTVPPSSLSNNNPNPNQQMARPNADNPGTGIATDKPMMNRPLNIESGNAVGTKETMPEQSRPQNIYNEKKGGDLITEPDGRMKYVSPSQMETAPVRERKPENRQAPSNQDAAPRQERNMERQTPEYRSPNREPERIERRREEAPSQPQRQPERIERSPERSNDASPRSNQNFSPRGNSGSGGSSESRSRPRF